jgi:23S rRNA (adenine2503-C2)-methyltransferase
MSRGSVILLLSKDDLSANFVAPSGQESRFVRRSNDYFIVYLSSHNGCNLSCRFCHLTQTRQTSFTESSLDDMLEQARGVLDHYRSQVDKGLQVPAQRVHFNWMARGEPLASSVVMGQWKDLTQGLADLARQRGLEEFRFNVSSIFPKKQRSHDRLHLLDGPHQPTLFYSLYSLDPSFRKRWLPKAADPLRVLDALADWQQDTGGEVVFHWTLIAGENDSPQSTDAIARAIRSRGIRARFNLVRYNPFSDGQGEEASEPVMMERFEQIVGAMSAPGSRVVPRVGFDVKASCGMFVSPV